ncbi:tRNA-binding protein [Candidatus Gracilibacteria bacterium]|nr:tRNA-binding protein [Candidatus Gracilibacteria bacterium]
MHTINWSEFEQVDLRAGTIIKVADFPEAKKPAYQVWIDFGNSIGIKQTSAQITKLYQKDELLHTQVICVINFPPKQIGPFMSEVLITGLVVADGDVVLTRPDKPVPNGTKLA